MWKDSVKSILQQGAKSHPWKAEDRGKKCHQKHWGGTIFFPHNWKEIRNNLLWRIFKAGAIWLDLRKMSILNALDSTKTKIIRKKIFKWLWKAKLLNKQVGLEQGVIFAFRCYSKLSCCIKKCLHGFVEPFLFTALSIFSICFNHHALLNQEKY